MPGFSHPELAQSPHPSNQDKGKGRAVDQLAQPGTLSGTIGSSTGVPSQNARTTVGGVQVESRYGGGDTLDEPILTTIVCGYVAKPWAKLTFS